MKKNCLVCNTEFETRYSFKKFCSDYCKTVYNYNKSKSKQGNNKVCLTCNKPFYNRNDYINYCSLECSKDDKNKNYYIKIKNLKRQKGSKKIYKFICECCGREFESYQRIKRFCSDDCINKTKKEKLLLDDGTYFVQSKEFINKANYTKKKKYGNGNWYGDKIQKTCREKYGVNWSQQSPEIRAKVSATKREKSRYDEEFIRETFIKNGRFDGEGFCEYYQLGYTSISRVKRELNITELNANNKIRTQNDIYNWIKSFYEDEVIQGDKQIIKPLELDIYIPDKKIAIEFDGLMFHSFGKSSHTVFHNYIYEKKRMYHLLEKTKLCEEKGIKLFHIFENEWMYNDKRDIWKSIIKNSLGLIENKLNARDCEVKEIQDNKQVYSFLEDNHLQGKINSKISIGLFYNNELVQVATFGKSRFNINYDYELLRQCTKKDFIVRGGFTKLLSYFKSNYKGSILSYGNRRWTYLHKNVYGRNFLGISIPNYFYFNPKQRPLLLRSRNQFQKHKLKNILENFDESLSETENMYNNGFRKVYDCGNLVYEL